jgi:histidine ammonia-lyase
MPPERVAVGTGPVRPEDVVRVARDGCGVRLTAEALAEIARSRSVVDALAGDDRPHYGVSTGFGALATLHIPVGQRGWLQRSLIRSHAAGSGPEVEREVVRALMLLRLSTLATGRTGVRPETAQAYAAVLDAGLVPVVHEYGSLGCSGDLAPLASVALALTGEGRVRDGAGELRPAAEALREHGIEPVELAEKEGLALVNGTDGMLGMLVLALADLRRLLTTADVAAAMSVEALLGTDAVFAADLQALRPHPGQAVSAANLRMLLSGSGVMGSHRGPECTRVQDAYSLRCAPQVLGAVADAIRFARETVTVELNASTDNPLVFPDGDVISGGNFHGQPVAQALDFLATALTTLQAIAERRVERLVNPDLSQGLPAFLTADPGLCSGFMMVQISAASLVAESRALAMPASIGSIPTDANQEDFVPMGMAAAWKAQRILANAQRVVGAELLCAAQGLEFLRPLRPGRGVEVLHQRLRALTPPVLPLDADRPPAPDLERLAMAVGAGELDPRP